jgi:hypothetical protein
MCSQKAFAASFADLASTSLYSLKHFQNEIIAPKSAISAGKHSASGVDSLQNRSVAQLL